MFHGACTLSQTLLEMISSPSVKKRRENNSYGDAYKAITKIETGEISHMKEVRGHGILRQTMAQKCKNKRENVAEKRPGSLPVLGEAAEKD